MPNSFSFIVVFFLTINFSFGSDAVEVSENTSIDQSISPCKAHFQANQCQKIIDAAGAQNRKNFLDCSKDGFDTALTCGKAAAGGAIISAVLPQKFVNVLGRVTLPIFVFTGGAVAVDLITRNEQKCYSNIAYKKAVLTPVTAYFGESYTNSLLHLSCMELETQARRLVRRVKGEILTKELNQQRYENALSGRKDDTNYRRNLRLRFPESDRTLTEQERRFLQAIDKINEEQLALLRDTQEYIKKHPCRSWDYYAKIFCGLTGGVAGSVAKSKIPSSLTTSGNYKSAQPLPVTRGVVYADARIDPNAVSFLKAYPAQKEFITNHANSRHIFNLLRTKTNSSIVPTDEHFSRVLTRQEYDVLVGYKRGNGLINLAYRNPTDPHLFRHWIDLERLFERSQTLESTLKKLPNYEGVVFRLTEIEDEKILASLLSKGSVFSDKGFLSTSRSHKIKDFFSYGSELEDEVFMVIRSRTGKSIENISNILGYEKEVIFKPGTRFIVEAVQKRPDGSLILFTLMSYSDIYKSLTNNLRTILEGREPRSFFT